VNSSEGTVSGPVIQGTDAAPRAGRPLTWGAFVAVVVLGLALGLACVALGAVAYRLLLGLEASGALPRHSLRDSLAAAGIGWQPFVLAASSGLFYLGFLLAIWLVVRRFLRAGWDLVGWRPAPWTAFAAVIPVYVLTLLVSAATLSVEARLFFHGRLDNPQQAIFSGVTRNSAAQFLLYWLVIAVLTPVVEETLFRGFLFQLLRRSLPLWAAVGGSALVFALAHGLPTLAPSLFIFGVALALVFHYTRSLYCSIFLHMLINSLAVFAGLASR